MDPSQFRREAPGEVVKIPDFGGWAFIPAELPTDWEFPHQLWPLLSDVKQRFGELEGIGKVLPNAALVLKPIRNREAIDSSTIEGTYASAKDMLLMQLRDQSNDSVTTNPTREVVNYAFAMDQAIETNAILSLETLLAMHRRLLTGTRGDEKSPGEFRARQVGVGRGYRFVPPPPSQLDRLLKNLESQFNSSSSSHDPLIDIFLQHYQIEAIHPFFDGNGRVGRAFMALSIYRRCGFTKPWIYLSRYFEKHREQYIERLFNVSRKGDWTNWIEFCLMAALSQANNTINICEQIVSLKQVYENRISDLKASYRIQQLLKMLFEKQFFTVAMHAEATSVSYPTANKDILQFTELKIVQQLPDLRPKTFYSPELFRVAYEE